jgi:zinc/manganese transport system permease protein
VPVLSMVFGFVSAVGGILIAIGSTLPISPFITTISFAIYLVCRALEHRAKAISGLRRDASAERRPGARLKVERIKVKS